ncbi:histidine kinase [Sphingopyxis sp. R3-92]|uniref:histidine kinase n=1 Tax=Sphingopyxis sp. R3-92 TaxID=3158553 RepID=UPI003EE52EFB
MDRPVILFASDPALLSALRFSLTLEGFDVRGNTERPTSPMCLIIDQGFRSDGLAWLASLRADGNASPAILLVTHPDRSVRASAAALGATLIEKPLTGDDLSDALTDILTRHTAS